MKCPKCGSENVRRVGCCGNKYWECLDCHNQWR